ncbi:hypothetical protein TI04_05945 [Achromatium sp. WMS2]|nr:hypothetical protein TI04_05945 [Achromatium sp. WMS2]
MKAIKTLITTVGAVGLSLTAGYAAAAGADLYAGKFCASCHGVGGKAPVMGSYPNLAGQNAEYCVEQIKNIRDGVRGGGNTGMMRPMVAGVTDDEATEICGYLASE